MGRFMHKRVSEIYSRLEESVWFCRCGSQLKLPIEHGCEQIRSWEIALYESQLLRWTEILNDANSIDMLKILEAVPGSTIDDCYQELSKPAEELVNTKLSTFTYGFSFPSKVASILVSNVHRILFRTHFSDIVDGNFYSNMLEHMCNGRFVCGWTTYELETGTFFLY